jgi:hypothetical protein
MARKADEEVVRPPMVKMIARFEILAGLGLLFFGMGILALAELIVKSDLGLALLGIGGLQIYGWASIALGIISFLVALGIWSMSSGGRNLALVACLPGIFIPLVVGGYLGQLTFVITLIIYPLVIYYLSREDVKEKYK